MGPALRIEAGCYTERGRPRRTRRLGRRRARGRRADGGSSVEHRAVPSGARPDRVARRIPPRGSDAVHRTMKNSLPSRARQASRVALIRAASDGPIPGTAAICSTGASRTRLIEPKTLSSSRLRFGPTPGRSSKAERTLRLARRSRWYVIANRWASSRRRWTRYSAGDVARQDDRVRRVRAGTAPRAPWPARPAAGRAGRARRGPPWRR